MIPVTNLQESVLFVLLAMRDPTARPLKKVYIICAWLQSFSENYNCLSSRLMCFVNNIQVIRGQSANLFVVEMAVVKLSMWE